MISLESIALDALRQQFSRLAIQRNSFIAAVRKVVPKGEWPNDGSRNGIIIPDGWTKIDRDKDGRKDVFIVFEIEDAHPLSRIKLALYRLLVGTERALADEMSLHMSAYDPKRTSGLDKHLRPVVRHSVRDCPKVL